MFAAIWKTVQKAINFISYVLLATAIFFAVTGIVFPFVYGANEIMASIVRFAIAFPRINCRWLSTAFGHYLRPIAPAL